MSNPPFYKPEREGKVAGKAVEVAVAGGEVALLLSSSFCCSSPSYPS